ncbi:hypothetical protein V8E54_002082 [Elaphomyces granulatus]
MDGPIPEADVTNRIKLLTILKETLQDAVPPTVWACLWLSDMEKLEELVDQVQLQPCPWLGYFSSIESNAKIVPTAPTAHTPTAHTPTARTPTARTRTPAAHTPAAHTPAAHTPATQTPATQTPAAHTPAAHTPTPQTPPRQALSRAASLPVSISRGQKRPRNDDEALVDCHSRLAKGQCQKRDGMRCLVTKAAEPVDVAHSIFPFSMRNLRQPLTLSPNSIWSVLRLFWTQDRIDEWYDAVFSSSAGTEVVSNLIDKKSLKVQFYWLPKCKHSNSVDILRVPTIPGNADGKLRDIGLWNVKTDQRIRSGDIIELETNDPEELPLPDFRLLNMQWMLHRVSALSGAAEPCDDDFNGEDDDDWEDATLENEEELGDGWSEDVGKEVGITSIVNSAADHRDLKQSRHIDLPVSSACVPRDVPTVCDKELGSC